MNKRILQPGDRFELSAKGRSTYSYFNELDKAGYVDKITTDDWFTGVYVSVTTDSGRKRSFYRPYVKKVHKTKPIEEWL